MNRRVFLDGSHIYLRNLDYADVEGNYRFWFNDQSVCRFNAHHRFPCSKEELIQYVNGQTSTRDRLVLAIIDKAEECHIGNVALQEINSIDRSAEFAIIIGEKEAWGKGLSKEAAGLIIDHGFGTLNLHRIYCGTSSENQPMQKLAIAMGFLFEGCRRQAIYKEYHYCDIFEYGLLRQEWLQQGNREG